MARSVIIALVTPLDGLFSRGPLHVRATCIGVRRHVDN